ncbi:isoprenoid synthase domain-containing protein [Globomyces pollinis-pini]|nr:isoprenoid synthase domain-containing protein [Globomyces pollinis-pini]
MDALFQSILYPSELKALISYKLNQVKPSITIPNKNNSNDMLYYFLNKTSRSFAAVIQTLHPELRNATCVFYLVLRALDTIEDDMTIPLPRKTELLHSFHELTMKDGWNFHENGPDEKDALLLKDYQIVIKELKALDPKYQKIIVDIAKQMGHGMAEFVNGKQVNSLEDFNLYCHYVAGLVGLGLTGLFAESGLESPSLGKETYLANEMGLFLQKVNILKDFLADMKEGRLFWPKSIWSIYVAPGAGPEDLAKPENRLNALACLNNLCANALEHVPNCLEYLSKLEDPSIFHFAAIPQVMALATFDLFYNNYELFSQGKKKIRKGLTVKLIQKATDMESLKQIYFDYAIKISQKCRSQLGKNPKDESFMRISTSCANVNISNFITCRQSNGFKFMIRK